MSVELPAAATTDLRAAMAARLATAGVLTDPLVREALLRVPREVLLPHAYVRVSGPGADPVDWRLLDGAHPEDRQEWLELIHSDESVLLQRDGEPLDALGRGQVTGTHMTSMSTYTPATVEALQSLGLAPGPRHLELGSGPGVSLALAAALTGPRLATGVERDAHMAAFARRSLDRLGAAAPGPAASGSRRRRPVRSSCLRHALLAPRAPLPPYHLVPCCCTRSRCRCCWGTGRSVTYGSAGCRMCSPVQKIDRPVSVVKRSRAATPATELPRSSRPGLHTHSVHRPGTTAMMPPPTPLLPGRPTR